jgi:hypothetical protein
VTANNYGAACKAHFGSMGVTILDDLQSRVLRDGKLVLRPHEIIDIENR